MTFASMGRTDQNKRLRKRDLSSGASWMSITTYSNFQAEVSAHKANAEAPVVGYAYEPIRAQRF